MEMIRMSYTDPQLRVHHLNGRDLAYELRGKTAAQRAVLAAEYTADDHKVVLHFPTEKQVAALFRISVATLDAAKALKGPERAAVFHRLSPLVNPTKKLERDIAAVGFDESFKALERVMDAGNSVSAG
jgi:hypothetical protein